ncbi:MAG: phage holin family protein [Cytophagaceae bacterium]|nr:phage holin family protein [Cytophagaceae bacterium]
MGFLIRLLLTAVAVIIGAYLLPGVTVDGFGTALIVALVLGLLNTFVKPLLVILTLPVTIITLGLFYLVINVIIIYLADSLIDGFRADGFITKLLFSLLISLFTAVLGGLVDRD